MTREKKPIGSDCLILNAIWTRLHWLGLHRLRFARLASLLDWRFVKDSVVVGACSTIARVLGLLFWILLAHLLTPDDVGFVRYSITLATIMSIAPAASPACITRFLATNQSDQRARNCYFSNGLFGVAILLIISLFVSVLALWLLHAFDFGTLLCVVGLTVFFSYFAVVRGLSNAWKMGLTYFLSNAVQIAALLVVLGLFGLHTCTIALAIYGLTYFAPFVLELIRPMSLRFHSNLLSRAVLLELARFATPVVLANAAYTIWNGIDVLFVENFDPHAAGSYAAAKTLAGAFSFVPAAVTVVLMPRVASLGLNKSKRDTVGAVLVILLLCLIGVLVVDVWGNKIIIMTFGRRYVAAYFPLLVMSIGMCFYAVYTVLEAFVIGHGLPNLAVNALLVAAVSTAVAGFWLTPCLGMLGASLSFTIGAALGSMVMLFFAWHFVREAKKLANTN